MAEHTPEPWMAGTVGELTGLNRDELPIYTVEGSAGPVIAMVWPIMADHDDDLQEANAARIVACVNALAGIEDPAAIVPLFKELLDWSESRDLDDPVWFKVRALLGEPCDACHGSGTVTVHRGGGASGDPEWDGERPCDCGAPAR